MAVGLGNPLGAVWPLDFGIPKIITGTARVNLSGGMFAAASGADAGVSSGLNTFAASDLTFYECTAGSNFCGVVLQDTTSGTNNYVSVAIEGVFIVPVYAAAENGGIVTTNGSNAVRSLTGSISIAEPALGRVLVGNGTSGTANFALCYLHI